jgi:hypothetical protein
MLVPHFCQVQTHLPPNLLSGNLTVKGLLYTFLGIMLSVTGWMGGFVLHFARHMGMPVPLKCWPQLFTAGKSVNSYLSLSPHLQMQWSDSQKNFNCTCRNCPHSSSYFQTGQPLQCAKLHTAGFVPDPRPPYYGRTDNCLTIMVYIQHNILRTSNPIYQQLFNIFRNYSMNPEQLTCIFRDVCNPVEHLLHSLHVLSTRL